MEGESLKWLKLRSTRHVRYWCGYHSLWIPKYRRDVLVGEVAEYARGCLEGNIGGAQLRCNRCRSHAPTMSTFSPYALHGTPPRTSQTPELKSKASRGKLWSRSYFVATVGNVTTDTVKRHVEEQ